MDESNIRPSNHFLRSEHNSTQIGDTAFGSLAEAVSGQFMDSGQKHAVMTLGRNGHLVLGAAPITTPLCLEGGTVSGGEQFANDPVRLAMT